MLVLTRRRDEKLVVFLDGAPLLTIMVVDTFPDRTRIGIAAPPNVTIFRAELVKPESLPPFEDNNAK